MSTKTKVNSGPSSSSAKITKSSVVSVPIGQKVNAEEQIQLTQIRAYELWEAAGRPEGAAAREGFWYEAEKDLAKSASDLRGR